MTTILTKGDYKVSKTTNSYFVIDSANQCLFITSSERKAVNYFNKVLKFTNTL